MLWKCCSQYVSKFGKLRRDHRTGKHQFSFQSQRRTVPKNDQTSVQFSSVIKLCLTLSDPMDCSTPGFPVHHQLLEFTQTHVLQVGDAIQPPLPLLSAYLLPSIFPSIRVFSNESCLHIRWPKYWSFSISISSSKEYLGLISFRMDWLDLLAVQGTFKSLLQHHSSKASILWHSAFFMVQLSQLHSFHIPVRLCSKSSKLVFSSMWNETSGCIS